MTRRLLTIAIEAEDTTCGQQPGHWCPGLRVLGRGFEVRHVCRLFGHAPLLIEGERFVRLPACLAAEAASKDGVP